VTENELLLMPLLNAAEAGDVHQVCACVRVFVSICAYVYMFTTNLNALQLAGATVARPRRQHRAEKLLRLDGAA
jgi:hypothetical protein